MTPARHMNVVAILRSQEAGAVLSDVCTDMNGTEVNVRIGRLKDVKPGGGIVRTPDVLLLDVDPRDAEDVEHLKAILHTHFPATPVVATAANATVQDVRHLMNLGVVDFVPQPITRADLVSAFDHAVRMQQSKRAPGEARGRVVSFMKAGGGVGATTLAVQSACLLASQLKRDVPGVCLLDLDIQFGAAALYLDLDNRVGLADLLEAPERLDSELLHSVMGQHASGLDLLAAPRDMVALDAVSPEFLTECLKLACAGYHTVILDLPEAWTPWSYQALESSDLVILVMQRTVAGIRQARRQLDTMQAHGLEKVPVEIALNRFEKGWGKSVDLKAAETALGRKIDHFIVNDYRTVSEALDQGVSLSKIKRKSKLEVSIRKMIDASIRTTTGPVERPEPRLIPGFRRS